MGLLNGSKVNRCNPAYHLTVNMETEHNINFPLT